MLKFYTIRQWFSTNVGYWVAHCSYGAGLAPRNGVVAVGGASYARCSLCCCSCLSPVRRPHPSPSTCLPETLAQTLVRGPRLWLLPTSMPTDRRRYGQHNSGTASGRLRTTARRSERGALRRLTQGPSRYSIHVLALGLFGAINVSFLVSWPL